MHVHRCIYLYTLNQKKKTQVLIMFLKHLQIHGAPGKGKKHQRLKVHLKDFTQTFVISYSMSSQIFKAIILYNGLSFFPNIPKQI